MEFLLPDFLIGLVAALTVVLIGTLMLRGGGGAGAPVCAMTFVFVLGLAVWSLVYWLSAEAAFVAMGSWVAGVLFGGAVLWTLGPKVRRVRGTHGGRAWR